MLGRSGTISTVFDLAEVRYLEGAPLEWRSWLVPGSRVVLRFEESGITVFGPGGRKEHVGWSDMASIDVRGPDAPEYPSGSSGRVLSQWWRGLVPFLVYLYLESKNRLPEKVEFSWLALRRLDNSEMLFEVYGALHDRLEAFLAAHSG